MGSYSHLPGRGAAPLPVVFGALLFLAVDICQAAPLALGARVGSAGLGPELSLALGDHFGGRLGAFGLGHGGSFSETGIDYDADLSLRNVLLLLDWHPRGRHFRFSAGLAVNGNRVRVTAPIEELLRRERPDLPPVGVDLGVLQGTARVDPVGPYVGLGWGNPFRRGRWALALDLGAVYHGRPSVRLDARTTLPVDLIPGGREELERLLAEEERALEEELVDYRYLPVISLGVTYSMRASSPRS